MASKRSLIPKLVSDQWVRMSIRLSVLVAGIGMVAFWSLATLGAAWLLELDLWWVVLLLALGYAYIAIVPALAHSVLILDLVAYAVLRRTFVFGQVWRTIRSNRPNAEPRTSARRALFSAITFADATLPTAAFARWSLIVLFRAPPEIHGLESWVAIPSEPPTDPRHDPIRRDIRRAVEMGAEAERALAKRFADRQFAGV